MAEPRYIGCTLKQLPPHLAIAAAMTAIEHNPANASPAQRLADVFPEIMEPQHIALLASKYWGAGGVKLGVYIDTSNSTLANKILTNMNAWAGSPANVTFSLAGVNGAQVRIALQSGDGYWSYLGTDILHIPMNQQTMNLDSFSLQTPDSEYKRVVRHETGHTLGFPHEHSRREIVALLDPQKVISLFEQTQGWSEEEIRAQILTAIEDTLIPQHTPEDVTSIMCYDFPGSVTLNGQPIPGGTDIDPSDAMFCAKIYPVAVTTPPVCPPGQHWDAAQQKCVPDVVTSDTTITVPKAGVYRLVP